MKRMIAAVLVATACASSNSAQAQDTEASAPPLTLDEALTAAGAVSPAVEVSRSGIQAAQAQRSIAGLRPNPSLDAMSENVAGTGIYKGLRSAETTVGVSLPLELGGKRSARVAVANAQLDRASLEAAIVQADLRLRVTQAYNDAAASQRRVVTAREQVGIANEVLRAARVRVAAGRASPLEEQRADVARLNAEGAAERAERSAQVALGNLIRLIGRGASSLDTAWFARIEGAGPRLPVRSEGTLTAAAVQADLTTATAQVRLARSQRVPDVTISASARRLAMTNDTAAVVGLSVPLPLFNNGRAAVDLASANEPRRTRSAASRCSMRNRPSPRHRATLRMQRRQPATRPDRRLPRRRKLPGSHGSATVRASSDSWISWRLSARLPTPERPRSTRWPLIMTHRPGWNGSPPRRLPMRRTHDENQSRADHAVRFASARARCVRRGREEGRRHGRYGGHGEG